MKYEDTFIDKNPVAFVVYSYCKWARHFAYDLVKIKPKKKGVK